jgi:hypothetical protein
VSTADSLLAELARVSEVVARATARAKEARAERDRLIRAAREQMIPADVVARCARLTDGRVGQIAPK